MHHIRNPKIGSCSCPNLERMGVWPFSRLPDGPWIKQIWFCLLCGFAMILVLPCIIPCLVQFIWSVATNMPFVTTASPEGTKQARFTRPQSTWPRLRLNFTLGIMNETGSSTGLFSSRTLTPLQNLCSATSIAQVHIHSLWSSIRDVTHFHKCNEEIISI